MPEFATPWALAVAPVAALLVWWLHARDGGSRVLQVSALYAWREAGGADAPRSAPGTRDPRWLLRAALAGLLFVAAAGPALRDAGPPPLVVWLDASASMGAVEADGPRAALAGAALVAALREVDVARVSVRSLRRPGGALDLAPGVPGTAQLVQTLLTRRDDGGGNGEQARSAALPPAAALDPDHRHWLVSDGADQDLAAWLARVPVSRVIQVGSETENVAITRLALRAANSDAPSDAPPSRNEPAPDRVLVVVRNLGALPARRMLTLTGPAGARWRASLVLAAAGEPGSRTELTTTLPAAMRGQVVARLAPGDGLTLDDELAVDASRLDPVPVMLDPDCAREVVLALKAHPGVSTAPVPGRPPRLAVACQPAPPAHDLPTLWFSDQGGARTVPGTPLWREAAGDLGDLNLDAVPLQAGAAPLTGQPLLQSGGRTLVAWHDGSPHVLQVALAVAGSELSRAPEFAALMTGLLDRVLGRDTLDPVVHAARDPARSRIAPRPLTARSSGGLPATTSRPFTTPVLILCIVLLLVDLAWSVAGATRARERARAGA